MEIWVCSYDTSDYSSNVLAPLIGWHPGQLLGLSAPWSGLDSYVNMNWHDIIFSRVCEPSCKWCSSHWSGNCIQCAHSLPQILRGSERKALCFYAGVVTVVNAMQVAATIAAHGNSVSVGMCQGYSAVLLPQLQQNGSQLMVTNEEASWIGKDLLIK